MQYKNFGKFIREKREILGMSLNEFAFNCNIEPATLSRFETGKSDILFNNFVKLSKGFNKTPSEILVEFEQNIK